MKKKAALHNLGCKVNAYETEAMQELLEEAGYEIVPFTDYADVYIINTCSVTNMADRKSRQMLHKAKKENPNAIIVAAGCYVQTAAEQVKEDGAADIIIGNDKKNELVPLLDQYWAQLEMEGIDAEEENSTTLSSLLDINEKGRKFETMHLGKTAEHTRAFIKVQDGCNQFCSYCIIPYARGRVRSRNLDDILDEIQGLAAKGYKEVVLTGIHLSSFGIDTGDHLLHLIQEVANIDGIMRVRLGSLEPRIITEKFAKALTEIPEFCPHFHLSLQSGCDETLKRMNRHYSAAEYEEGCKILRKYFEHPAITTDVIVGFPGETEEEFEKTYQYMGKIALYETHIFKYSKRKGTKAAVMDHQIPEKEKAARSSRLIQLGKENAKLFRNYYLGKEVEILLEETIEMEGKTYFTGFTKEYVKVVVEAKNHQANTFVKGRLKEALSEELYLMVEI